MSAREPLRPGYKQTEVGVIPEDWELFRVDQIGDVKGGKRLPLGRSLTDRRTRHPYIRVSDMKNGTIAADAVLFVPEDVFPSIRNYRISSDDIYISVAGTLGLIGRVPPELDDANLTENADKITNLKCERDFLYFCLTSDRIQTEIQSKRTVGAQPKLTIQQIEAFQIPLPPEGHEQRAIAAALSDADALIASLDALIAKKRDIKEAAMQQLLTGKTRLPGFSGEWEVKRLGEYGDFKGGNGFALKYQGNATGEFPFFKVSDMNNEGNSMSMSNSNHWVSEEVRRLLGARPFPRNSIVFAKIGAAIFLERKKMLVRPSCIDNNMMAFVFTRTDVDPGFFHYRFLTIELGKLVSATALPSLNGRDIAALKFEFPPPAEQSAIAAVLSGMDAELAALEAKRDKTRALKTGMMQELLTGRIRLI